MSRRKTVQINFQPLKSAIDKAFRSNNTSFCIAMGFENRTSWVSDLKRGRNLPSPEEAAKMCLLLNTTPEEILLTQGETDEETAKLQADIALVSGLIERERESQGIKKDLPKEVDGEISKIIKKMPQTVSNFFLTGAPDELDEVEQFIEWLVSKREKREGGL